MVITLLLFFMLVAFQEQIVSLLIFYNQYKQSDISLTKLKNEAHADAYSRHINRVKTYFSVIIPLKFMLFIYAYQ